MENSQAPLKRLEKRLTRRIVDMAARYYLKKPDQAELISIKLPTFKSMINAGLNELAFKLGLSRGYRLTTVNLEATNSCNIRCKMCPVSRGMERKKGFMSFELFKKVIDENPRLEFILPFQWGEPLLHKQIFDMVRYAKDRGIMTMLTSNATLFNEDVANRMIDSGLTRITVSIDGVGDTYTSVRGVPYSRIKENVLLLKRIRDERGSFLKIDVSMVVFQDTESEVERFFAEWRPLVDRVQAIPVFTSLERKTPCRELWRGILVVLWDGRVTVCCADYDGIMIVGDANRERLADIWNGPKMRQLRKDHMRGRFTGVCKLCGEYESTKVSKRFQ